MAKVKYLCDIEVGGEVQGNSLDINGSAVIDGNLTLQSGGPNLTLKDTTDNDDQQIHFVNSSGGIDYRIHTGDFTGGGLGDGLYIGSTGANEVVLVANDNNTLIVRSDGQTNEAAVTILGGGGTNAENIALLLAGDTNGEALKLKIQNPNNGGTLTGAGILSYEPDADTFNIGQSTTHNNMAMSIDNSENVTFKSNVTIPEYIIHTGDINTYFGFSAADTFKVFTGASERLVINSSGLTTQQNITASNIIIDDDGQIGSQSEPGAMEIDDGGSVSFNGGISIAGTVKATIKTRVGSISSGTDADYKMGDVAFFGSTTSMDAGKIYYYNSSGNWALIDADAASTSTGMIGVALGSSSNSNGVLLRGFVTLDHDPGSVGNTLFLSTTAGTATATAPSGSGDIVRVIGYCLHASNGAIFFNPDGAFVEVA